MGYLVTDIFVCYNSRRNGYARIVQTNKEAEYAMEIVLGIVSTALIIVGMPMCCVFWNVMRGAFIAVMVLEKLSNTQWKGVGDLQQECAYKRARIQDALYDLHRSDDIRVRVRTNTSEPRRTSVQNALSKGHLSLPMIDACEFCRASGGKRVKKRFRVEHMQHKPC